MRWVRLMKRVEEHACPLNATNLSVRLEHDAIERSEVTFGVYRRLQAGGSDIS